MDSPRSQSSRSRSRSSSPGSGKSRSPARSPRSASSRSRSSSRSGSAASRSRSKSHSSVGRSSGRSRSGSGSRSSSPRFVSATPSGSDSNVEKKSGNASSVSAASSNSSKGKKRLKAKERKVSSQLAAKMDENSDDDDDHIQVKKKDSRLKDKQTAKGGKKDTNKRSKQKTIHEASEEGEVSSEEKEFDDGLDEDLMGNEEDRDYLEGLTEKEREEELFKRAENREQLKKRFEIQKKLRIQQKLKGNLTPRKRKSISEDDEPSLAAQEREKEKAESGEASDSNEDDYSNVADAKVRAQDRQNKIYSMRYDKKSSALSELKAKRQERERKDQERKEKKELENRDTEGKESSSGEGTEYTTGKRKSFKKERSRSRSSSSSRSGGSRRRRSSRSSSSSSVSSKRSGSASPKRRKSLSPRVQEYIENQEDLEPIRLSRFKLERFLHLPFFKRLAVGCFVRIGIGTDPASGKPVYRCSEIADVVETAKIYAVGKARTNVGLKLKFGQSERVFRLEFISNSPWIPQEFLKWKNTCEEANMALPSLEFVRSKTAEIKKAMSYEYTSEDVDKIVATKERFHKHPVNYAMYKARLLKEKDLAVAEGDESKSGELETKLNEIEERAEELDRRRTHTISSVALINDRNRKANVSKAEEAIRLEMRREKKEGKVDNPFKRRKCNPRMVTKVSEMEAEQTSVKEKDTQELKRKVEQAATPNSKESHHAPEKQAKKNETESEGHTNGINNGKEDLFDAHNFDIEIDVDTNVVAANPVNVNLKPVNLATKDVGLSKRSLNLDDYKKKRGLI